MANIIGDCKSAGTFTDFCPGRADVRDNDRAHSLASKAPINGILNMCRAEIQQAKSDSMMRKEAATEETIQLRLLGVGD